MTPTQDELRQLYEAGMPHLEKAQVRFAPAPIEFYYQWDGTRKLRIEAALVGYATQLLRDLFPNETRNVRCDGRNGWLYDNIKYDNYPSLVAMIVDLARMKKERVTEKLERCAHCSIELPSELRSYGYCGPRCEMLASANKGQAPAPESVTTSGFVLEQRMSWVEDELIPESVTTSNYEWSVRERQELDKQLDQLRADVREIADILSSVLIDGENYNRLRKVVER